MSLAETAVLAVELKLNGGAQYKAGVTEAEAATAGLNRTVKSSGNIMGGTASNLSLVKQAAVSTGQAIGGIAAHFKSVITGPLGLLGLGAGLFTIGGLLKQGTEEASSFGLEVAKLSALTGQSVEAASAMAAALDHFGISGDAAIKTVGMLTKNIGGIVNSKAGLAGFAKTFGLSLTDAHGKLVDINEEILRTADYFNNKNIPATEKAAALAKLYGRSWQTLIPFLSVGRKGITEAEVAAKELGLTLTKQNLGELKQYRENFLTLGDATKGLQLQLGLVVIPLLADLAKSFTAFLRNGGREQIVTAFKGLVQGARDFGHVMATSVIPVIKGFADATLAAWNTIPPFFRDWLIKGVVADRTIHFLLGVSPLNLAKNLIGDVVGPVVARLVGQSVASAVIGAGIGKAFIQPVFVTNWGGLPGGIGGAGEAVGGAAASGLAVGTGTAIGLIAGAGIVSALASAGYVANHVAPLQEQGLTRAEILAQQYYTGDTATQQEILKHTGMLPTKADFESGNARLGARIAASADGNLRTGAAHDKETSDSVKAAIKAAAAKAEHHLAIIADRVARGIKDTGPSKTLDPRFRFLAASHSGSQDVAVAHALVTGFEAGNTKVWRSTDNITRAIKVLQADQKTVAAREAKTIGGYIDRMKAVLKERLVPITRGTHILATAAVHDKETSAAIAKLVTPDKLRSGVKQGVGPDMETLRGIIGTKLAAAEHAAKVAGTTTAAATRAGSASIVGAIRANRPITNVQVNVSATTVQQRTTVIRRYGPTGGDRNTSARQNESFG